MADKKKLATVTGGSAALLIVAMVARFEGKSNDPYLDIVNVQTVCYGETRVKMRRYSDKECEDMLADALVDYAEPVLARNPNLAGNPNQLSAAVSLTYNIGVKAYKGSTVARKFQEGKWKEACDAFLMWNKAGGRPVAGLTKRRQAERAICLKGL